MSFLPDWLTGYDRDNAARAADSDAVRQRLNEEKLAAGSWTLAQYQQAAQQMTDSQFDADAQIAGAFTEEWNARRDALTAGASSFLSGALKDIWRAVPLAVWLLLAAGLFFWLGGAALIRNRISNA